MLKVNMKRKQDQVDIILEGELDMSTEGLLDEAVDNEDLSGINKMRLILTQLEFIDSTGIGKLIKYYRKYTKENMDVEVENKNPDIEEVLELIGLRQIMAEDNGEK